MAVIETRTPTLPDHLLIYGQLIARGGRADRGRQPGHRGGARHESTRPRRPRSTTLWRPRGARSTKVRGRSSSPAERSAALHRFCDAFERRATSCSPRSSPRWGRRCRWPAPLQIDSALRHFRNYAELAGP